MTTRFSMAGISPMRVCAAALVLTGIGAPRLLADPPARAGRLNYIDGVVFLHPGSVDEWAAAEANRTLTTGDALWTDINSRSEFHVGSTAVRLGAQTEFDIVSLNDNTFQGRLAQGLVTIRIRSVEGGAIYEIDTPNGAVTFGEPGEYRINVDGSGTRTTVAVWSGSAEVTAAGSSFRVGGRQLATINGTDAPTYDLTDVGAPDDWDAWALSRDRREDASRSVQYVSREMPGYEDLDEYGHWTSVAEYGNVWIPNDAPAGWAPYRTGHWVWVDPWGWTWVDAAPWGYAPYHYGRWAYVNTSWCWVPGPPPPPPGSVVVYARPVYAPALVAFIGGPGWSVSVGVGGGGGTVGWIPLGPGEAYRPAYAASPTYVRQVNVTNVTNVTNITNINNTTNITNVTNYRNARAPGAVTAVSQSTMASGQPVARSAVVVTPQQLATARTTGGAAPVVPTRAAVVGAGAVATTARVSAPPPMLMSRAVVAKTAPPPAVVPFAQQQRLLATNGGRPLEPAQTAQIRQTLPPTSRTATVTTIKPTAPVTTFKPATSGAPVGTATPQVMARRVATPPNGGNGSTNAPIGPKTQTTTNPPPGVVQPSPAAKVVQPSAGPPKTVQPPPTAVRVAQPPSTTSTAPKTVQPQALGQRVAQPPTTTVTQQPPRTVLPPKVAQPLTQQPDKGQVKGEVKGEVKGDTKGDVKGDTKGDVKGDTKGEPKGARR